MATLDDVVALQRCILDMQTRLVDMLGEVLKDGLYGVDGVGNVRDIVCKVMQVAPKDFHGPSRAVHIVRARQAFCWLAREVWEGNVSYPSLGKYLGKDHTTIINSTKRAQDLMQRDPEFRARVERCLVLIKRSERRSEVPPAMNNGKGELHR